MALNDEKVSVENDQQPKKPKRRLSRDIFKKLEEAIPQSSTTQQSLTTTPTLPKIQGVPIILHDSENFKKFYVPRAVAIGPIHHAKPEYEEAEKFKYKLAADFMKESGKTSEVLCSEIQKHIVELRACYVDEATTDYDDECLGSMLFLDGCSILQFIHKYKDLGDLFKMKRDFVAFVDQDLFLLENQVPYKVLELLMSLSMEPYKLKKSIMRFVQMHSFMPDPKINEQEDHHTSIEMPGYPPNSRAPTHLLELLRSSMVGRSQDDGSNKKVSLPQTTFRNVQELNAAGIYFKPSEGRFCKDVSFITYLCFSGILKLPKITIDESTGPKFMNLIAFEMCPDFQNDSGITSYICFLDSLIDHPDDVKHLKKKGVLRSFLRKDEDVIQLFRVICTDLVPNIQIYGFTKAKIERHCMHKWNKWIAIFVRERLSSPWTLLAFLGGLLALILTCIQTWYTCNPPGNK